MPDKRRKRFNKRKKARGIIFWEYLKRYLENSSIHGVKYLVEDGRHWSERLFWVIICSLSWLGCGVMISSTIYDFSTNKAAITTDTTYLNWEVNFPAIHFCFSFSDRAKDYAVNVTGINPRKAKTTTRLSNWLKLGYDEALQAPITAEQFEMLSEQILPKCKDLFGICMWNDESIDCCAIFMPLASNLGRCLSFNSIHTNRPQDPHLPRFVMNHHKRMAKFTVFLNKTAFWDSSYTFLNMFITSQVELPTQMGGRETSFSLRWRGQLWDLDQIPTDNDDGVISMSMNDRRCRLTSEIDDLVFLKAYSYHGCLMESQMRRSQELCGCVGHMFPPCQAYRTCNSTELKCVGNNRVEIVNAVDEACWADCEETAIQPFLNPSPDESDIPGWAVHKLEFNLMPGPFTRYRRYTVRSILDVVVAVGGAVGLFVGASVLSIVEIPYWLLLRRDNPK